MGIRIQHLETGILASFVGVIKKYLKGSGEMKDSNKYLEWKKKMVSEMRQEEYDRAMKNWTLSKDLLDSLESRESGRR